MWVFNTVKKKLAYKTNKDNRYEVKSTQNLLDIYIYI